MKKISYLFVISVVALLSCEKNEVAKPNDYAVIESIKSKATALSNRHDSLVIEMLKLEKHKKYQKERTRKENKREMVQEKRKKEKKVMEVQRQISQESAELQRFKMALLKQIK